MPLSDCANIPTAIPTMRESGAAMGASATAAAVPLTMVDAEEEGTEGSEERGLFEVRGAAGWDDVFDTGGGTGNRAWASSFSVALIESVGVALETILVTAVVTGAESGVFAVNSLAEEAGNDVEAWEEFSAADSAGWAFAQDNTNDIASPVITARLVRLNSAIGMSPVNLTV